MRLPKQFKHWCSRAGLRQRHKGRHASDWHYLKGHGREWRINCHGMLQCGDKYEDFNRWALCNIREADLPTCLNDFINTVNQLVKAHEGETK